MGRKTKSFFKILNFSAAFFCLSTLDVYGQENFPIGIAVEFTNHAACAYVSLDMGWMEEESLKPTIYRYMTGMSLAAALGRGDIEAAYLCLLPAINAYANAQIPIKVVAGTHKQGYGLMINPGKIKTVKDLEKPGIRIGCVREGGPSDAILMKTIENCDLDPAALLTKIQRMNPAKQIMSIRMGRLDAAFLPEHWPALAEKSGFRMLLQSQDVWPGMQGSVLVVREELIRNHPEVVEKLIRVTYKATKWIKNNTIAASKVMARQLSPTGGELFPSEIDENILKVNITPEMMLESMNRMKYSVDIDPCVVQEMIDYAVNMGNIRNSFDAGEILDLSFLDGEDG